MMPRYLAFTACAIVALGLTLISAADQARAQQVSADASAKVTLDFSDPTDLEQLRQQYVDDVRYAYRDDPGSDGKPGSVASLNRGLEGEQLWLKQPHFDLRYQTVDASIDFQAAAASEGGISRVFLGLAETKTNLQQGASKLGVRIFKGRKPKHADRPFVFQLVNGVATRILGTQFQLEDDQWYRLSFQLKLDTDGRKLAFEASLVQLNEQGQPVEGGLVRIENGTTSRLSAYNLQPLMLGLLGQNNHGGAVAFDRLRVVTQEDPAALEAAALEPVTLMPAPMPEDVKLPKNTMFGVCGHFMHTHLFYRDGKFGPYWQPKYTLPLLIKANMGWVREGVYQPWFDDLNNPRAVANRKRIESYLQIYQDAGLSVMLFAMAANDSNKRHAPLRGAYFDWIGDLAAQFDCIKVIELHNEPNLKFFWHGTVEDYVRIYRKGVEQIKSKAPDVDIAVASISSLWYKPGIDWLKKAISLGVLEFADGVAVHPYNKKAPPEVDPHFDQVHPDDPEHNQKAVSAFYQLVQDAAPSNKQIKLYFTEFGWSSGLDGMAAVGDEQRQADYLSRILLIYFHERLNGIPIESVYWYDFKNDGQNDHAESNFGLVSYDTGRLKPAFLATQAIARTFDNPGDFEIASDIQVTSLNLADATKLFVWRRVTDRATVIPFWRMGHLQRVDQDFVTRLDVTWQGQAPQRVMLHRLDEYEPREIGFEHEDQTLSIPVHVSDRASWLIILPASGS